MNRNIHYIYILALLLLTEVTTPAFAQIINGNVYGGGEMSKVDGNTSVTIIKGTVATGTKDDENGDVYGGGLGNSTMAADITGNTQVNLGTLVDDGEGNLIPTGDATVNNIFGCNNTNGAPGGTVTVTVTKGTVKNNVYGGGNLAAAGTAEKNVSPAVNINGGIITENVYGGGYGASAVLTGNTTVNVAGGTIAKDVYGGGALANITGSTAVNVSGGSVTQDVYGGGALANVSANTSVNLTGGTISDSYGGGLGSNEVAALIGGDATTTLNGSIVLGNVFGCNNLNGTPQGHVKVHVFKTTAREGQTSGQYDVPAVYGGGNQAAYVPSYATFAANKGFAEVLIENCDNSIGYVYGGGNAAPVPATQVTIYGANAIDNAFAGGNGAGDGNPGADIGYNGYYSKTGAETPTYGTGESHITIYGGTVNNVYGGSNTLGYIRTHAYVDVLEPDGYDNICELNLGNVSVGGNEAEMFCGGSMTLSCADGAEAIYAGANKADVHGDIDLKITSGTYGKVFGGNNNSGNIYGHIRLDIDEIGCWPVMIGELYGCGNNAPYSVYGYTIDDEGNSIPRTKEQFDDMTDVQKVDAGFKEGKPYDDPTINIISCTRIDRIFGGGNGGRATVYGNPTVNINTIKGKYAGESVQPSFVLDNNGDRVDNNHAQITIPDETGHIGTVYGGGNQAAVYGNTLVKIGTEATNKHVNVGTGDEADPVSVIILGNVFGGSKGVSGNSDAGRVTGTTKVIIGGE